MRTREVIVGVSFLFIAGFLVHPVHAQSWTPPSDQERCPSKWGAGDERGAGNHMGRETVVRAAGLIRTGNVFELSHVLSDSIPLGDRHFDLFTIHRVQLDGDVRTPCRAFTPSVTCH